jgi:FMN phosphatase YigB (HAD superfamily)
VRLVVIDLIPALLSWEGRDRSSDPDVPPDAAHALEHVYGRYRIAGIADADETTADLRARLEQADLAVWFDGVTTSAEFGPEVSPRVVRRVVHAMKGPDDRTVLVTAREHLVTAFGAARIPVVLTSQKDFAGVPAAVFDLLDGRVNP